MPIVAMMGTIAIMILVGILFINAIFGIIDDIPEGVQVVAIISALISYAVACIKFAGPIYSFILL